MTSSNENYLIYLIREYQCDIARSILMDYQVGRVLYLIRNYQLNRFERDEIVQEALIQLWKCVERYDEKSCAFRPYSNVILKRTVSRTTKKLYKYNNDNYYYDLVPQALVMKDVDDQMISFERVYSIKTKLSELELQVFEHYFQHNLSANYIAQKTDLPIKKIYYIIGKIKKYCQSDYVSY